MDLDDLLRLVELVEAGKLTVPVAAAYPLKEAAIAQLALRNGGKGSGKIVLENGLGARPNLSLKKTIQILLCIRQRARTLIDSQNRGGTFQSQDQKGNSSPTSL